MTRWARFRFWLRNNASTAHNRLMARYLKRQGWVVFYLDSRSRVCRDVCWMALAESGEWRTPPCAH